jgi:hypothetical protein
LTSKDNDGKIACKACPMVQNVVTGNVHFDKIPLLVESMEDGSESLIRESGQRITAVMARRRRRRRPGGHTTAVGSGGRCAHISTDTASHTHTARSLACPLLTLSSARPFSNGIFRSNGAPSSLPPASSSLTHARRMDGFCNQNADHLGSLAGQSLLTAYVGVVECAPASPYTYSSSLVACHLSLRPYGAGE